MTVKKVRIANGDQIPAEFGQRRRAIRTTTVAVREARGVEVFEKAWGTLTAHPDHDLVIVQDSGDEYPIKKDIFAATYEQVAPGRFRKTATSELVQVPEGVVAVIASEEGDIEVRHPDYVVVGAKNEVYANNPQWVAKNLEFLD